MDQLTSVSRKGGGQKRGGRDGNGFMKGEGIEAGLPIDWKTRGELMNGMEKCNF